MHAGHTYQFVLQTHMLYNPKDEYNDYVYEEGVEFGGIAHPNDTGLLRFCVD